MELDIAERAEDGTADYSSPAGQAVTAASGIEERLLLIWREVLDLAVVARTDDFFTLGGDSFAASLVMSSIEDEFGTKLPLSTLVDAPTVAQLALIVARASPSKRRVHEVLHPTQPRGTRPPIFLVHGWRGVGLFADFLGGCIGEDQPLYTLQSRGLADQRRLEPRLELIAAAYVSAIRTVQPHGPYFLGGYCAGSTIALEMAQQLQAAGETVGCVVALDPGPGDLPGQEKPQRCDNLKEPTPELIASIEEELRRNFGLGTSTAPKELSASARMAAILEIAFTHYRYAPFHGRLVLVSSSEQASQLREPTRVWRRIATQGLTLCVMPGVHSEVFVEKARDLAKLLRLCVDGTDLTMAKLPGLRVTNLAPGEYGLTVRLRALPERASVLRSRMRFAIGRRLRALSDRLLHTTRQQQRA